MISVVIPCYNEEEVLPLLYKRLTAAMEKLNEPFEVILVDDGSAMETWRLIKQIHKSDKRWKAISFSRNFGHQTAVSAGINHASGDAVIIMDADLQDPPEELYRFIEKWREGYKIVYAIRTKRKENFIKRFCYKFFYRILGSLANINIPYDAGDFCLMDRKVIKLLKAMPEKNRFVRGLRAWVGLEQIGIEYERCARAGGEPQYTFWKLLKLASDGVFSFSVIPLRLATYFGLVVAFVSFLGIIFTFSQRIFSEWFAAIGLGPVPGFATIVISMLFFGGIQLVFLGILGEYIGRIYEEVKGRPPWVIREALGIEHDPEGNF